MGIARLPEPTICDMGCFKPRCHDAVSGFRRAVPERDEATRLLRWYVESDLFDGGDEFGAWDDEVREFVVRRSPGEAAGE